MQNNKYNKSNYVQLYGYYYYYYFLIEDKLEVSYEILVQFFADDGTYFQRAHEQEENTEQYRKTFENYGTHFLWIL